MAKISIGEQPVSVRNAVQRLLKDHHFDETPSLAQNAIHFIVRLHNSGICDEDELVEFAVLSGGKPLDERGGAANLQP